MLGISNSAGHILVSTIRHEITLTVNTFKPYTNTSCDTTQYLQNVLSLKVFTFEFAFTIYVTRVVFTVTSVERDHRLLVTCLFASHSCSYFWSLSQLFFVP